MNGLLSQLLLGMAKDPRGARKPDRLARDRTGGITLIFATSLTPLCMLAGLIIDYGWVLQAKSKLDLAADAAAMAAVRTAASGFAAGQSSYQYMAEGTTAASQWWTSQAGTVPLALTYSATPTLVQTGTNFSVSIAYTATIYEIMPKLFNWAPNVSTVKNSITASITVHGFGTVDFLLDNTSSMMLPEDDTELVKLQAILYKYLPYNPTYLNYVNTAGGANALLGWSPRNNQAWNLYNYPAQNNPVEATDGSLNGSPNVVKLSDVPQNNYCAFACHWDANSTASNPTDYYGAARAAGELLRFDVVQSAAVTAIQQMVALEQTAFQLSVGVFAFGGVATSSSAYLQTIFPEATIDRTVNNVVQKGAGATAAENALGAITPPVSGDQPNTNIGTAMANTLAITGQGGTGYTSSSPKKSLIMVTDGIEDDTSPQSIPSTEGPINPAICNAMKNAGYTIYILYTPYNSEPVYLPWNAGLAPYINGTVSPSVNSALVACTGNPSNVIQATSQADIQAGMVALLGAAVGNTTELVR